MTRLGGCRPKQQVHRTGGATQARQDPLSLLVRSQHTKASATSNAKVPSPLFRRQGRQDLHMHILKHGSTARDRQHSPTALLRGSCRCQTVTRPCAGHKDSISRGLATQQAIDVQGRQEAHLRLQRDQRSRSPPGRPGSSVASNVTRSLQLGSSNEAAGGCGALEGWQAAARSNV